MQINKLYSAMSFVDNFEDRDTVTVNWYYGDVASRWKDIDYYELIADFKDMSESEKSKSIEIVNQHFTGIEIDLLRDYLRKNLEIGLYVLEESLPIKTYYIDSIGNRCFYESIHACEYSENTVFLNKVENYSLDFAVSGRFDPDDGLPYREFPDDCTGNGIRFVEYVLQSLNQNEDLLDDKKINEILKNIYKRYGYYASFNLQRTKPEKSSGLVAFKTFYSQDQIN
jgi:hypothetical protein